MDRNGIGTDASIPQHMRTICTRGYVVVCDSLGVPLPDEDEGQHQHQHQHRRAQAKDPVKAGASRGQRPVAGAEKKRGAGTGAGAGTGRHMVPTELGLALIAAFQASEPELARPDIRARMETQVALVADGKADMQARTLPPSLSARALYADAWHPTARNRQSLPTR